jgi:hypothetical protein
MKIQYFVASMAFAAVLVAPTAYSAPGGGTQVTHFLTRLASFYGRALVGSISYFFSGQVYDDMTGAAQGYVYSEHYDDNTDNFGYIYCGGPAYANAVTVKGNGGSSSINATLDPASPDCDSYNVLAPLTVTANGQFDGNYSESSNGISTSTFGGTTYKYNTKSDVLSQTFSADNGFYSGTFTGNAYIGQNTNRTQVK